MNPQIKEQLNAVARMESNPCRCMIYHPVGEEWNRVYAEWRTTHSASAYHVAQLFGACKTQDETA
jgi:hypothetical protein